VFFVVLRGLRDQDVRKTGSQRTQRRHKVHKVKMPNRITERTRLPAGRQVSDPEKSGQATTEAE